MLTCLLVASSIETSPAQESSYEAEAYECNGSNNRIKRNTKIKNGESIRICVKPDRAARQDDVFILKIANFVFRKTTQNSVVRQESITDGLVGDNNRTRIACWSGSEVCAFTTYLREEFFETDGTVRGFGEVALQFGADSLRHRVRNLAVNLDFGDETEPDVITTSMLRGAFEEQRNLQSFAGWSNVAYEFDVEDGNSDTDIPGFGGDDGRTTVKEHWRESPDYIKALYVLALLVILIILCCLCGACLLWRRCCADIPAYVKHSVNRVTRGAYFQDHADPPHKRERDDVSETYSDEEELDSAYPQHVDDDSSSEEMSEIDIKEEMLLDDKPYNESTRKIDESMMLANEPYNEGAPHGQDDGYADDEGDGSSRRQSERSLSGRAGRSVNSNNPRSTRSTRSSKPSSTRSSRSSKPSSKRSSQRTADN